MTQQQKLYSKHLAIRHGQAHNTTTQHNTNARHTNECQPAYINHVLFQPTVSNVCNFLLLLTPITIQLDASHFAFYILNIYALVLYWPDICMQNGSWKHFVFSKNGVFLCIRLEIILNTYNI